MATSSNVPSALKAVKPFLKRAEELEKSKMSRANIIAYYCRAYAAEKSFAIDAKDKPGIEEFLTKLLTYLEAEKSKLGVSKDEAKTIVRNFSLGVFKKADDEYRAGKANKGTARSFYAAGSFLEVNNHFGEEDPEIASLRKYAKMKATEILLAIREGRKPLPPDLANDSTPKKAKNDSAAAKEVLNEESVQRRKEDTKKERRKQRRKTRLEPRGVKGNENTKKAEALGREAVRFIQREKYLQAVDKIVEALNALGVKKAKTEVNDGIDDALQEELLESTLYGVRSLECIGKDVTLEEGINLAIDHFSEALMALSS